MQDKNPKISRKRSLEPLEFPLAMIARRSRKASNQEEKNSASDSPSKIQASNQVQTQRPRSVTLTCPMASFGNAMRLGVIPGLDYRDGTISINPARWECCGGRGLRDDLQSGATYRCELLVRFQQTKAFFDFIKERYPEAELMSMFAPPRCAAILDQLSKIKNHQLTQGRVFIRDTKSQGFPAVFWATGVAAVWRFGLKVKVRGFGEAGEVIFGPKSHGKSGSPGVTGAANAVGFEPKDDFDLLMVYNVKELLSVKTFEYLDYTISMAYNACKPLFIDFIQDETLEKSIGPQVKAAQGIQTVKSGYQNLLAEARRKTLMKSYPQGLIKKFRAVSLGLPRGLFDV